jgi:HlyD family secretion protein
MDGMDKIIEPKKGIRKKHLIWGSGILLLVLLILYGIFGDHSSVYKVEKDRISIGNVDEGLFNDYISLVGQVEPIATIYLDALEGGRVSDRLIEEGSTVKKGDIILKLENRQLYQTIMNSETSLAEKENSLRNTRVSFEASQIETRRNLLESEYNLTRKKRTYEQDSTLYTKKYISQEEYIQAREDYFYQLKLITLNRQKAKSDSIMRVTSIRSLEDDLVKMRQVFGLVRERMEDLNVKAPVDGQLGMLDAEIGQSINAGQRLGQINILTDFKLTASIDEHYIDRVTRGLSASFDRNDANFDLMVRKVYPEVRAGQFRIDMVFKGKYPENIRTGQTYQVRLELGESQKAVMIPKGGFFQSTGGQWIYVLNASETEAVKRSIRIGRQNPQFYEIIDGLRPGEKVVTSGYELFGDNDKLILK